jgi:hypothetical protein
VILFGDRDFIVGLLAILDRGFIGGLLIFLDRGCFFTVR